MISRKSFLTSLVSATSMVALPSNTFKDIDPDFSYAVGSGMFKDLTFKGKHLIGALLDMNRIIIKSKTPYKDILTHVNKIREIETGDTITVTETWFKEFCSRHNLRAESLN